MGMLVVCSLLENRNERPAQRQNILFFSPCACKEHQAAATSSLNVAVPDVLVLCIAQHLRQPFSTPP